MFWIPVRRTFGHIHITSVTHTVSTEHIKYPDSSKPPPPAANGRKSIVQPGAVQPRPSVEGVATGPRDSSPGYEQQSDNEEARRAVSPTGRQKTNGVPPQSLTGKGKGKMRDEDYDGESSPEMVEAAAAVRESAVSPDNPRAKSPTGTASRAVSPSQGAAEVYDPAGPQASLASVIMSRNGLAARSPSPVVDRSKAPLDAFFKPASPTMNGFAKPGSTGNITADLIRDLKDKEAEVEALKKKEAWMKAALLKAERSGFIYAESEEELSSRADDDDIDGRKVTEMVINLKQLKAKIQVCGFDGLIELALTVLLKQASVLDRAKEASDRVQEAERVRASAVQEAAFYRAKLAALEASSENEVARMDRERIVDLERQLAVAVASNTERDRKIQELNDSLSLQTTLLEQAEARADDASKRADTLGQSYEQSNEAHNTLRERNAALEAKLREATEKLLAQTSLLEQHEADYIKAQSQLEDLVRSQDQHVRALDQTRSALAAASARA